MVIPELALVAGHPPLAAMVLVTEYVPGVLAARFTVPVDALMDRPVAALNVPATPPPLNTGEGSVPFWQYGEAE